MNKSKEYFEYELGSSRWTPYLEDQIETMNRKTLEDVKELIGRLKELGYDEIPENWYVDGKEFLTELEKLTPHNNPEI